MKLAIIFGGVSFEHEISIVSAIALKDILKFELTYIFLDESRDFYLIPTDIIKSNLFSSGEYKKLSKLTLKQGGFYESKKSLFKIKEESVDFDVALNLIHGGDGEDGKLASIFEFMGVDYIGPRVEASVLSFNKHLTKLYARDISVSTVPYQLLNIKDKRDLDFDYPVIIKPLSLGSSIGVSVASTPEEFEYGLDVAYEFDNNVLIEPFLEDLREFNVAGFRADKFIFSKIEEPTKNSQILDFDKKYMDFGRTEATLSEINENLELSLKEEFAKVYNTLFDGALIRCDFFYHNSRIYLNEINPIPGSMANYLFDDFNEAIETLTNHLPKSKKIEIDYKYINSIQSAKGK